MNTKFLITADSNRSALLKKKIIHYYIANGDATIAELCKEMDLSIPTVTKLVGELLDDGYILDFGKQETNGGRKPNIYGLNPVLSEWMFSGVKLILQRSISKETSCAWKKIYRIHWRIRQRLWRCYVI